MHLRNPPAQRAPGGLGDLDERVFRCVKLLDAESVVIGGLGLLGGLVVLERGILLGAGAA